MRGSLGVRRPAASGVVRTFDSFSQAGYEDAESRIWLGVHFRFDADDGFEQGYLMGTSMAGQFFERTCRADISNDGSVTSTDMTMFTNAYFAGDRLADFNRDGVINSTDAVDYMNAYLNGCGN